MVFFSVSLLMQRLVMHPEFIPYVSPAMLLKKKKTTTHNLVMELSKDILNTGRNVTGERFYSAINTAEELQKNKTTYVGTIMSNRKQMPQDFKISKGREILSTKFLWKKDSPVMALSCCPKKNKTVLLITTAHEDAIILIPFQFIIWF